MAKPWKRQDSRFWWISPTVNGIQVPQSSRTTDYQEALDMIRRLEGRIADGQITPLSHKTLLSELLDDVIRDYRIKKRSTIPDLKRRITKHIKPLLGDFRASRSR